MHQIVKIVGVSAEQVGILHHAVERAKSDQRVVTDIPGGGFNSHVGPEILKSQLDKSQTPPSYTVTILIPMIVECSANFQSMTPEHKLFYPSIKMMRAIYDALGTFSDEERLV